jgi:hypothetical protein
MLHSSDGLTASGTAYLSNSLGAGAVSLAPPSPVTVSSTTSTAVTLFSGLTLPPGTYFVTISNTTLNLQWDFVGGGATESLGAGVTSNGDEVDLATPIPAFPPSSVFFEPATAGGSNKVLLFAATGTTSTPTGVPTLSAWAILITACLLAASALLLMDRRTFASRT